MSSALVEKATNDFLLGPDWSMNLEICDIINADPGQAKDVIKAIKKRLGNKNSKIQILAMTVLETVIKNCGANVHQQIAEKDVLHEMVKIVKKKADLAAKDKAMVLLDSWQEAFGGQQGKYPQYFAAYDELRKMGVEFPRRSPEDDVPIFTPPQSHPINGQLHEQSVDMDMLGGSETPGDGDPGLSLADMQNARHGLEILLEMLNAADPRDKKALKGELIMELVEQCRSTQQRVSNLVSSTSNEGLLCQALSLNDDLQIVLAKHASLLSGMPMKKTQLSQTGKTHHRVQEEDETEDDFSQLAHRSSSSRVRMQTSNNNVSKVPPPPSAMPTKKTNPPSTRRENTVDLLSGDSYDDRQFNNPVAMGNCMAVAAKSLPHDGSHPFSATPQQRKTPVSNSSQYQQQEQHANAAFSAMTMPPVAAKSLLNDGSHPFSATPQQRKTPVNNSSQYQQQEQHANAAFSVMTTKKMGQAPPFPGFALPASSSNNANNVGQAFNLQQQAALYGAEMQSILQAQKMQGGYEDSSGWNTSHVAPGDSNQGSRSAPDSNQGSVRLPPPPIYHAQRQQFFHQKRVGTDDQATEMYSANDVMARTRNLTIDEARQWSAHLTGKQQPDSRLFEDLVITDMHNARIRKQRPPQNPSMGTGISKE